MSAVDVDRSVRSIKSDVMGVLARVATGTGLATALAIQPDELDSVYSRGYALLSAGRLTDARQVLAALVALEPTRSRGWAALGVTLEKLGERADAAALLAIGAAIDDSAPLWLRSAECSQAAGYETSARRAAANALAGRGVTELLRQRAMLLLGKEADHD